MCEKCHEVFGKNRPSAEFAHVTSLESLGGDFSKYHSEHNILHLCNSCHKTFDYAKGERKKRWTKGRPSELDLIVEIVPVDVQEVFDIEMDTDEHNFVADGIVSHNSHSYDYSVMTMQCAHLATYHPLEFYAAVLTKGQSGEMQDYVSDIKKTGVKLLGVDVNESGPSHRCEDGKIRLAFSSVLGVGPAAIEKIAAGQPYSDFRDFLARSGASKTSIAPLIKVGAFDSICQNMKALDQFYAAYAENPKMRQKKNGEMLDALFAKLERDSDEPDYPLHEKVGFENELMGFSLKGSPFEIMDRGAKLRQLYGDDPIKPYAELIESDEEVLMFPVAVREARTRPQRNGAEFAFLKLAIESGEEFEAPCFANIWKWVRPFIRKGGVYVATFSRREGEPTNLIVGKPGFRHTMEASQGYFVDVDALELPAEKQEQT